MALQDKVTVPAPDDGPASDLAAADILRGTSRMLVDAGLMPLSELTLPNGRRADIVALDRNGAIIIIEIKSCLTDFRTDQKWPEYADYCDRFYFAVTSEFPREVLPPDCGLIVADRYGAEILRPAKDAPSIAAARRKVMTLRFARVAALRLAAVDDPALKSRSEARDV